MSNILAAIRSRNKKVSNVRVEVTGILTDSLPVRYSGLELTVDTDTSDRALHGTLDLRVRVAVGSQAKVLASA